MRSEGKLREQNESAGAGLRARILSRAKPLSWALLAGLAGGAAQAAATDPLPIPGNLPSVARLYGGLGESDPDRFVPNLLLALLAQTSSGHNWDLVEARVTLVDYLADLEDLRKKFGSRIEVAAEPKEARKRFDRLCEGLGYDVAFKKGQFRIVGKDGAGDARRRRLALALGWNFEEISGRLGRGERVVLEIEDGAAPTPIPLALWTTITGKPVAPGDALERLAKDQRLTYVLAGLLRQDEATVQALGASGVLNRIYDKDPAAFFRYSAAIRVADGAVVPPGGSAKFWEELVGESTRSPSRFVPELLSRKGGRLAYLWEAIWSAPPGVAAFYLGSESRDDRRYLRRVLTRLDNATEEDFAAPSGGRLGFGSFVRSMPLTADGTALDLPGGPGLWWTAVRGEEAPESREALARIVRRGLETRLDDGELILRVLGTTVNVGGYDRPAMPRLVRAANLFPYRRELLTPENVVLATRMVDAAPAALDVLESLPLARPESVTDYLLAVTHLLDIPRRTEAELHATLFQAGVETLRALGAAGRVDPARLEERFAEWARLHQSGHDPFEIQPRVLAWLDGLASALPEVAEGPGRGPRERALLAALASPRDPQRFTWEGVEYEGRRGSDQRRGWERFLADQSVPSLDGLLTLADDLRDLRAACAKTDLAAAQEAAVRALAGLDALPPVDFTLQKTDKALAERVLPVDRAAIRATLLEARGAKKQRQLAGLERDVARAIGRLARETRVVLLAPAYLRALGLADPARLAAPGLVRGHLLLRSLDLSTPVDTGWNGTDLVRGSGNALGARVVGPVAGVARAVAEAGLAAIDGGEGTATAQATNAPRLRLGFEDLAGTAWPALTPEVSGFARQAIEAGEVVVSLYRALGPAAITQLPAELRQRASLVPAGRLEPGSMATAKAPVALSERLQLGLALVDLPPGRGAGGLDLRAAALREAAGKLGGGWRQRLAAVGVPMPNAVGRAEPTCHDLPSFESLDHDSSVAALHERERLETKLAVVRYLGARGLPGEVGADLFAYALADAGRPAAQTANDWEEGVRWSVTLDDAKLDGWMRELLRSGRYSLAAF